MSLPAISIYEVGVIGPTFLQARADITDRGGSPVKRRGFVYSLTSKSLPGNVDPELSGYDFVADERGSFLTGDFDIYLSPLSKDTIYYIRAFCKNKEGFAYSGQMMNKTYPEYYPFMYYPVRERLNKEGVNYDPDDPRKLFATDLQNFDDEIYKIEHELGLGPKGSDATVKARLARLDGQAGWKYVKGGNFTGSLSISSLDGDVDETYKVVMRVERELGTYFRMRFNSDGNSRYSYHKGVRGFSGGVLKNVHSYNQRTTSFLFSYSNLPYFYLQATINVKRNGFVSISFDLHGYDDVDNYIFVQGDGMYDYMTSKISSLLFYFSGTLDSGSYRFYKLV
jgi:hypothetical protein